MIRELHLKGAALLVFALWYTEREDRSVQELAEMLDLTERGVRKVLPRVQEAKEQSSVFAEQSSLKKEQSSENSPKMEQSSSKKEQSSEIEKESFPHTPIKENISTITSPTNAPTRPRGIVDFIDWVTDDDSLRPYAEEFVKGLIRRGENPEERGAAELKRHFGFWLPKYQAKREIMQRQVDNGERGAANSAEENWAKRDREAKAAALDAKADEAWRASQTEEARAAAAVVLAKYGRGRRMVKG